MLALLPFREAVEVGLVVFAGLLSRVATQTQGLVAAQLELLPDVLEVLRSLVPRVTYSLFVIILQGGATSTETVRRVTAPWGFRPLVIAIFFSKILCARTRVPMTPFSSAPTSPYAYPVGDQEQDNESH